MSAGRSQNLEEIFRREGMSSTQATILRAALSGFTEFGYGGVTITEVAKRSKMSKPRVLYHFRSTDEMLVELAKAWGETGRKVTLEHLANLAAEGPEACIVGMSTSMFQWMQTYTELAKVTPTLFQATAHSPQIAEILRQTFDMGRERIADFLIKVSKNKSSSPAKIKALAQTIHMQMIGASLYIIGIDVWHEIAQIQMSTGRSILLLLGTLNDH